MTNGIGSRFSAWSRGTCRRHGGGQSTVLSAISSSASSTNSSTFARTPQGDSSSATQTTGSAHDGELLFAKLTDANSVCLRVFLAFREEGFLRRTFEWFSTAVHSFRFARFLLAFLQKLFFAAPASGLPSEPTALLSHVWANTEATPKIVRNAARRTLFISRSPFHESQRFERDHISAHYQPR